MNQFFYESRAKEKLADLRAEGIESQAFYRSGAPRLGFLHGLPKLMMVLAMLGLLVLLVR
jgi:hypothetical protein